MPSIGACLIVRDGAAVLPACLTSLKGAIDALVVVDTGSVDESVGIARHHGARVVEWAWRDDFAAARNVGLEHCRTEWVLSIDADEVAAIGNGLREHLARAPEHIDAYAVEIELEAARDSGGILWHREAKLFRRQRVRWQGRVHERLVRANGAPLHVEPIDAHVVRLLHRGYDDDEMVRMKAARNARLAELELAGLRRRGADAAELLRARFELARGQFGAGSDDSARASFEAIVDEPDAGPYRVWALDFLARLALRAGEPEDALGLIAQIEQSAPGSSYAAWLRALAFVASGRREEAAVLLEGLEHVSDLAGRPLGDGALAQVRRYLTDDARADAVAEGAPPRE
ncbi:MAG: glycosyltransferase [Actinomycetota bacterium]|nr:glycosyltransferase [Actinomycetota bacterium]